MADRNSPDQNASIGRRQMLQGALGASLAAGLASFPNEPVGAEEKPPKPGARQTTSIAEENAKTGSPDWQLTYTRVDPETLYRSPWIEGYVSQASVKAGDALDLFVSTRPVDRFRVQIYRLGYYGGAGGRLMADLGEFQGSAQPDPPVGEERLRECRWESTTTITIPADWPSGVYLGKLSLVKGRYQSYVVFIVRDERPADVVFQCSDNTWQAYNRWPDNYSLYDADTGKKWNLLPGVKVSYDRPYGKYCQILDAPLSQGAGEFGLWEFPFAYWLEQHGYDVSIARTPTFTPIRNAARAKLFLSVGHDEYWSLNSSSMLTSGGRGVVGFFSGNTCCFVSPFRRQ